MKIKNLDNNDVKQVVYKKDKNENVISKEKPKNYVVSNEGFVKINNNNEFFIYYCFLLFQEIL